MTMIVVAIGGSLLRPEVEEKHVWLNDLFMIIRERVAAGDRLGLVIGGGAPAREGISLAKPLIDVLMIRKHRLSSNIYCNHS